MKRFYCSVHTEHCRLEPVPSWFMRVLAYDKSYTTLIRTSKQMTLIYMRCIRYRRMQTLFYLPSALCPALRSQDSEGTWIRLFGYLWFRTFSMCFVRAPRFPGRPRPPLASFLGFLKAMNEWKIKYGIKKNKRKRKRYIIKRSDAWCD